MGVLLLYKNTVKATVLPNSLHALAPMPSIRACPLCIEKVFASHDMCVCYHSVTEPCPTLSDPVDCSRPGSSVLYCVPEFAQTHVR